MYSDNSKPQQIACMTTTPSTPPLHHILVLDLSHVVAGPLYSMMSINGFAEGEPLRHPLPITNISTAHYATQAILAALLARQNRVKANISIWLCLMWRWRPC